MLKRDLKWVDEDYLKRAAHILGEFSAAALALKDGEALRAKGDAPMYFNNGGVLLVVPESILKLANETIVEQEQS